MKRSPVLDHDPRPVWRSLVRNSIPGAAFPDYRRDLVSR